MFRCAPSFRLILPIGLLFTAILGGTRSFAGEPRSPLDFPMELVPARCIGPANMGGRVTDIALDPKNPARWVVATASGGLWITENSGKSWATPFDGQSSLSIGAVALNPKNPQEIWVGTGESNARNSVSQGNGIYLSVDNGKTWIHKGLPFSRHVGRIAIDAANPKKAFVAALGPLWSAGGERGLYLTEDLGATWKQVLPIPADVGCIDIKNDPFRPDHWVACAYRVRRDRFAVDNPSEEICQDAGLYQSSDGGKSWTRLSEGLPQGGIGRCGVEFDPSTKDRLMAVIQAEETDLSAAMGQNFTLAGKPVGPTNTGGIFESINAGRSWQKVNDLCPRPFYFSQIRIEPANPKRLWVLGIPLFVSSDSGKNFRADPTSRVHPDHHALVFDAKNPKFALLGNDGGLYSSHDGGKTWTHHNNMVLAQFYAIDADRRTPYRVMGGLQDNGSWIGATRTGRKEGILASDWTNLYGADGFQARQDPNSAHLAYLESQYGGLRRHDLRLGLNIDIRPRPPQGQPPYRFNWNSPVTVSRHTAGTLYFGGNRVFRSRERGANWKPISPDLTCGQPTTKHLASHTLTTFAEDKKDPRTLWAGSDDGLLHISRDDGQSWKEVGKNLPLPGPGWITWIEPLSRQAGTALVTVDRHRQGDCRPYLFLTLNGGETWIDQSHSVQNGGQDFGILHTALEFEGPVQAPGDSAFPAIAFLGTENGLAMTVDGGQSWKRHTQIPRVPVHGLCLASTEKELVIGTHGRGVWIADISRVGALGEFKDAFHLIDFAPIKRLPLQKSSGHKAGQDFVGANPKNGADIWIHLPTTAATAATATVLDEQGQEVAKFATPAKPGFHHHYWEAPERNALPQGQPIRSAARIETKKTYRVVAQWNGQRLEKPLELIDLP